MTHERIFFIKLNAFLKTQQLSITHLSAPCLNQNLLHYVPYVLSCPTGSRASRVSCPMCFRSLRALVSYMLSCPTFLVPYVVSYLMWLVPYVLLCFTCLVLFFFFFIYNAKYIKCLVPYWPRVSRFMSPFSLRILLFRTLRTLCPSITFCALEFPCISLLFFCSFSTCDFLEEIY